MNTWIAVILAIVAILIAAYCMYKLNGKFKMSQVDGLEDLKLSVVANGARSAANATNIAAINTQLGVVQTETSDFTSTAATEVEPAFPLVLV